MKKVLYIVFICVFSTYSLAQASFFDGDSWEPITANPEQYIDGASVKEMKHGVLEIEIKTDVPQYKKDEFLKSNGVSADYFVYKILLDHNDKSVLLKSCSVYDSSKK